MKTSANHSVLMKKERDKLRASEIVLFMTEKEVDKRFYQSKILSKEIGIEDRINCKLFFFHL